MQRDHDERDDRDESTPGRPEGPREAERPAHGHAHGHAPGHGPGHAHGRAHEGVHRADLTGPGHRLRAELPQEVDPEDRPAAPAEPESPEPGLTGRQRLLMGLWPPRVTRAQLIVALLLFGLGFGLAVQVASNSNSDSALRGARQEDLVRILDELGDRNQRLQDEKQDLEAQRRDLENSSDQADEARKQTALKERQLGILAGTVAAQGPGITVTVDDPHGAIKADMLLDAVEELRAAGAEAIQVNGVRVVAATYLTDSGDGIAVDGNKIQSPYSFKVIGRPQDLEPALNIPGGVVQTLEKEQATVTVERETKIVVDALRAVKRPDYARSSSR